MSIFSLFSSFIILFSIPALVSAKLFRVGGDNGWTTNQNYSIWSENIHFHENDLIEFVYDQNTQHVFEVGKKDFDNCNDQHPIHNWTTGSGSDVIPLPKAGIYYFISGSQNCYLGVKVYVEVLINPPISSSGSTSLTSSSVLIYLKPLILYLAGTQVICSKYAEIEKELKGVSNLMLNEDDIVGILETEDVKEVKPLRERVLIKVEDAHKETASGLLLTEASKENLSVWQVSRHCS